MSRSNVSNVGYIQVTADSGKASAERRKVTTRRRRTRGFRTPLSSAGSTQKQIPLCSMGLYSYKGASRIDSLTKSDLRRSQISEQSEPREGIGGFRRAKIAPPTALTWTFNGNARLMHSVPLIHPIKSTVFVSISLVTYTPLLSKNFQWLKSRINISTVAKETGRE